MAELNAESKGKQLVNKIGKNTFEFVTNLVQKTV